MKRTLVTLCLTACACLATPAWAAETLSPEKTSDIRRLMDVTGALRIGQLVSQSAIAQITQGLKNTRPDVPQEAFTIIGEEVNKVVGEEMSAKGGYIEQMIPVFHKYLTHEEIKGLLAFYTSPLGKKATSVLPMMAQEGMQVGQRWAKTLGPKLDQRLKARFAERGIKIEPAAKPAEPAAPAPVK